MLEAKGKAKYQRPILAYCKYYQEVLCLLSKVISNGLYRDGDLKLKKPQS